MTFCHSENGPVSVIVNVRSSTFFRPVSVLAFGVLPCMSAYPSMREKKSVPICAFGPYEAKFQASM